MTVLDHEQPVPPDGDGDQGSAPRASPPPGHPPNLEHQPALSFEAFVADAEPRLRRALVAAYGPERGRDAVAEALAYAWEHWHRLGEIENLPGYLFRVAQSKTRPRYHRATFEVPDDHEHLYEPNLMGALATLSERQRLSVVLVHGLGWTLREVAELTGTRPTTVQNHLERGLRRLRAALGVCDDQ